MTVKLEDTVYFHFGTSSATTGAATNADTPPTVTIEEDGVALVYSPTPANVAVGLYRIEIVASAANGFEAGRRYSVYAVATVGGITGRDGIAEFEVVARGLDDLAMEAGGNLATVMGKTNNLPTDPADESLLEAAIAVVTAKTNNLPTDPADESLLEAAIAVVSAKTNNLPADPASNTQVNTRAAPGDQMSLIDGAITVAKAPNLDAAITSRAVPGDAMTLTGVEETAVADAVLMRDVTTLQATAPLASLVSVVLGIASRMARALGFMRLYRLDGTTVHMTQAITTDATAAPVTDVGVGT